MSLDKRIHGNIGKITAEEPETLELLPGGKQHIPETINT